MKFAIKSPSMCFVSKHLRRPARRARGCNAADHTYVVGHHLSLLTGPTQPKNPFPYHFLFTLDVFPGVFSHSQKQQKPKVYTAHSEYKCTREQRMQKRNTHQHTAEAVGRSAACRRLPSLKLFTAAT